MIFYITKYALTQGIVELDTDRLDYYKVDGGRLHFAERGSCPTSFAAGEWYTLKEAAIGDAERRRRKRIESLKKQIENLEGMSFG